MSPVGLEATVLVFERTEIFRALNRSTAVIGDDVIKCMMF